MAETKTVEELKEELQTVSEALIDRAKQIQRELELKKNDKKRISLMIDAERNRVEELKKELETVTEQKEELETETDGCDDQEAVNPVAVESGQASQEVSVQCLTDAERKRVKELMKDLETVMEQKEEMEPEMDGCDDQEAVNPVAIESGQASQEESVQCMTDVERKRVKELKKDLETVMEQKEELETEMDGCDDQEAINPVAVESGQASEEVSVQCIMDELKKELETVIGSLMKEEDDDCNLDIIDEALTILVALEDLKNPVVVESGQVGLETVTESGQVSEEVSVQCSRRDQEAVDPVVLESVQALLVQCSKIVKELKKELEPVIEALMMEDDGDRNKMGTDNAIQILLEIKELRLKMNDQKLKSPVVDESGQESDAIKQKAISLLKKLPCSSVSEDIDVMTELVSLMQKSSYVRGLFGRIQWPINKLLNQTTIERSQSDVYLQALMSIIVLIICKHQRNWSTIIQNCSETIPFLIACLRTQAKTTAAAALSKLSVQTSNRKMMGESGVIGPVIKLIIFEEDSEALTFACMITYYLCLGDVENRERAVSEGVVGAVMDKIRRRIHVEEMLRVLEVLSKDERVVPELEENGILQWLFMILREDVDEKMKEYCMNIIHKMCHGSVVKMRKINKVKNARQTLLGVVRNGTVKANEKARELLSGLKNRRR